MATLYNKITLNAIIEKVWALLTNLKLLDQYDPTVKKSTLVSSEKTASEQNEMMGGLTFMYNGKMCLGIIADEMMCRIDPAFHETAVEQ